MSAPSFLNRERPFVSYAGNLEDVILNRAFPHANGFYVDIGANEPVIGSNTWALYERGWSGIAIDPLPGICARFTAKRPRDLCLGVAVGDTEGEVSFFLFEGGAGHSTIDRERAEALRREVGQAVTEIKVPVRTLGSILYEHAKGREIDVVSIDAEGVEAAILRGARLHEFRPKLIIIEAMAAYRQVDVSQEATRVLEQSGYVLGYEDGLNKFFVAKEHPDVLDRLRYPPNVFDNYVTEAQFSAQQAARRRLRQLRMAIAGWAISLGAVVALALLLRG